MSNTQLIKDVCGIYPPEPAEVHDPILQQSLDDHRTRDIQSELGLPVRTEIDNLSFYYAQSISQWELAF
jgi:hypothetical protein